MALLRPASESRINRMRVLTLEQISNDCRASHRNHRRDAEDTEEAQRKTCQLLCAPSATLCVSAVNLSFLTLN
jgi:hypothetical protein